MRERREGIKERERETIHYRTGGKERDGRRTEKKEKRQIQGRSKEGEKKE